MQMLSLSLKEEVKEEPLSDEAWDSNRLKVSSKR